MVPSPVQEFITGALEAEGATVEVRSNLLPPVTFDAAELTRPSDKPNPVLALLGLTVTVRDAAGGEIYRITPAGEPLEYGWLLVLAGAVLALVLFLVLVWKAVS